jgi:Ca-activated chloride channel homolog
MDLNHFHFAHPLWLWGGLAIPLMWILFFLFYEIRCSSHRLEKFIDSHLLPHLLLNHSNRKSSLWKTLFLWSIVWSCLNLALAGPRWNFREMETFSRNQSLVILLDLSESMNATDIKPSRLIRAKQKIEDFVNLSRGVKIGLIAFAADPHMITPVTDDKETLLHLLPSLDTDLVYLKGSRLTSALDMASNMLEVEPGHSKALLVISDGGFEDASAITTAKKLAEKGIAIHVMGVGTIEGAPLQDHEGSLIKKNGIPIISKLEKERLGEINKAGNGHYLEAHYSDDNESMILNDLKKHADVKMEIGKKNRFWDERFYLFIFPVLPIILWWFRRGVVFVIALFLFTPAFDTEAVTMQDYFKNTEEIGREALDEGDYEKAINAFQDPYRKGVACYKAGNFPEAEKFFSQSSRLDVASNATYNLGNCLVQQQKLKEAIVAYEDVLKKWPDHIKAKENLDLVKKMLDQKKEEDSQSENSDQQQDQEKNGSENENRSKKHDPNGSNQNEQDRENERQQNHKNRDHRQEERDGNEEKQIAQKENEKKNDDDSNGEQKESQEIKEEQENQKENESGHYGKQEAGDQIEEREGSQKENREVKNSKSQEDQDADLWLDQIVNDPKMFLQNKFMIESKRNGTKGGIDPW